MRREDSPRRTQPNFSVHPISQGEAFCLRVGNRSLPFKSLEPSYGFDEVAYMLREQFEWLQADLQAVDRARTPWVVLMSHRPMYCSVSSSKGAHLGWPKQAEQGEQEGEAAAAPAARPPPGYGEGFAAQGLLPPEWDADAAVYRPAAGGGGGAMVPTPPAIPPCGIGELIRNGMVRKDGSGRDFGVEPLMEQHGVDLYLCGHEHNYERLFPVLNGSYTPNGTFQKPGKPVHIVTGAGGAYSKDPFTVRSRFQPQPRAPPSSSSFVLIVAAARWHRLEETAQRIFRPPGGPQDLLLT